MTIYTIGHSTRTLEQFLALLERSSIECLVDVRRFPGSRRYPHFNREALESSLGEAHVRYVHAPALGGRRRAAPDGPPSAWRNESFPAYAEYMSTPEFRQALDNLIRFGTEYRMVIMCSEAVPWRCHRTMISDALVARGIEVEHILDAKNSPHQLTSFAVVRNGEVTYPAPVTTNVVNAQHVLALGDP